MSVQRKIAQRAQRRASRVRASIPDGILRISIFRSLKHIYAQIINDAQHATVASCSSHEMSEKSSKSLIARAVGKELARRALSQGITQAAFDRGTHRYHGRVRELAEGLREGGLNI